jgi:AraC-like DNA-binding protein
MNKHFRFSGTDFANRVDGPLGVLPFYAELDSRRNEAAYLLGYENANSFVRAFPAREGTPPGQIKR